MQYPGSNITMSKIMANVVTVLLQIKTEVAAAISILPNFSSNHKIRDELENRQRGIITTGHGYQPPKSDKPMASTEVAAVKKAAAKKLGRVAKANTGASTSSRGGKRQIATVNNEPRSDANAKEAKSDSTGNGRTVSAMKQSLANDRVYRAASILQLLPVIQRVQQG
jgi:hypothetical protein